MLTVTFIVHIVQVVLVITVRQESDVDHEEIGKKETRQSLSMNNMTAYGENQIIYR